MDAPSSFRRGVAVFSFLIGESDTEGGGASETPLTFFFHFNFEAKQALKKMLSKKIMATDCFGYIFLYMSMRMGKLVIYF